MLRTGRLTLFVLPAVLGSALLVGTASDPVQGQETLGRNLVVNPSFETVAERSPLPQKWRGPTGAFSVDRQVKRTGSASLRYENHDAGRYCLCSQTLPVRPGWKYRIAAWVKTQDIAGDESGATICMEWNDKQGRWLGGCYPDGVKGTRGWTRVEEVARVPKEAGSVSLKCYVRPRMTGTAWFDDVEVLHVTDPPMRSVLVSPIYRGRITAAGPAQVRARVRLNLADRDLAPQDVRVLASLKDARGADVPADIRIERSTGEPSRVEIAFPAGGLAVGNYDLEVRLLRADGELLQAVVHRLVRTPGDFHPRCTIDQHRRLLVDGKPFFPIGMYWSGINEKDLDIYARSKFNCLMPYGSPTREQMDQAERHGLKVIYSIKDWYAGVQSCPAWLKAVSDEEPKVRQRVRRFRGHPALLAWYLNDELSQKYLPRLAAHQRWVTEEDPDHPTWIVLYQVREVGAYLDTFDVIGTDPYPIGRKAASMAADWTIETRRQVEGARPMWQVPQLHNWANYRKVAAGAKRPHTPTYDEVRSMAWQCICEGATGLVFYSWFDVKRNPGVTFDAQWAGLKKIAAEIDRAAPVLLAVEPAPSVTVRGGASGDNPDWLHVLVRRRGDKVTLFAANDGDGEGAVRFTLPAAPRSVRETTSGRAIEVAGQGFRDEVKKLDVKIYEIELPAR